MTDHTPEPWTYRKMSEFCQVRIFCGARLMTTIRYGSSREAQGAVDLASRIVACVNACAGIPTGQLGDVKALVRALLITEAFRRIGYTKAACDWLRDQGIEPENTWSAAALSRWERQARKDALAPFRKD